MIKTMRIYWYLCLALSIYYQTRAGLWLRQLLHRDKSLRSLLT